jgi:hypothetical protein
VTEQIEPMTPEAVAELAVTCIEATVRRDRATVEAAIDRVFLQGTPEDGLRLVMACLEVVATRLTPTQAARAVGWAERLHDDGAALGHPGELLFLRMLADAIRGDHQRAIGRWVDELVNNSEAGAPGHAIGVAIRQAAMLIRQQRAKFQ